LLACQGLRHQAVGLDVRVAVEVSQEEDRVQRQADGQGGQKRLGIRCLAVDGDEIGSANQHTQAKRDDDTGPGQGAHDSICFAVLDQDFPQQKREERCQDSKPSLPGLAVLS
jgi:hypothetical protein